MNPFDRMPGPGPRGDNDGLEALHALGMLVGLTLATVALVLFAMLVWNSFKMRAELRGLRGEVARLGGAPVGEASGGAPARATPAPPAGVNHGLLAVPPAPPAPPAYVAAPPAPPTPPAPPVPPVAKPADAKIPPAPPAKAPAAKSPRAPRTKPATPAE